MFTARARRHAGTCALWVALASCANFNHLHDDLETRMDTCLLYGDAEVKDWSGKPLVVVAISAPQSADVAVAPLRVQDALNSRRPGEYSFRLDPGKYWVGAFEDQNADGRFQNGERGQLAGPIEVKAGDKTVRGPRLVVSKPYELPPAFKKRHSMMSHPYAAGEVLPLTDARFGQATAFEGLWTPWSFIAKHQPGIYFLQSYAPTKIPVLFVHGMSGYPQEFKQLIAQLDPERFQPWVALYPSGYELRALGLFLAAMLSRVELEQHLERLCIVAHSMGGLVTRSALLELQRSQPNNAVRTLVTINSPFGGMPSAAWGLQMAPEVVPAWVDIAPDSDYLQALFQEHLSDHIEYNLLFALGSSGEDDGVVPLTSQLRSEAQGDAELVRGYRATHTGSLRSPAVAAQVLRALDRCSGRYEETLAAPRPPEPKVVE